MNHNEFELLEINEEIMQAIRALGFESMTPIQRKALPIALEGNDLLGQAQTGTGKTLAFALPVLARLYVGGAWPQAVILCPTRELAIQVCQEFRKLSKYMENVKILPIYGGQHMERQLKSLEMGTHVIIATPGRLIDHMHRGSFDPQKIGCVVLDEADKMLNMGFREDIEMILAQMERREQTMMFSATMPKDILTLAKRHMRFPEILKVEQKHITVPHIKQYYFEMHERQKIEVLSHIIEIYNPKQVIVFCNTKKKVNDVACMMRERGYMADKLHGDLQQSQRNYILSKFRNEIVDILIATDVAARGLDIDGVDMVINFDVPQDDENYVHRVGRTGRAGREGVAFTLVLPHEYHRIKSISNFTHSEIIRHDVPTHQDINTLKNKIILNKIAKEIEAQNLDEYGKMINQNLAPDVSLLNFASYLLKEYLSVQKQKEERKGGKLPYTGADVGMVRVFINVGKNDGVRISDIVGAITGETGLKGDVIGQIQLRDKYSFAEIPEKNAEQMLSTLKGIKIKGKRINVEWATQKQNYVTE